MQYPNVYYEQLANRVIKKPALRMKRGEVCFYQGGATTFENKVSVTTSKPKTKTKFLITPWFGGIKRIKESVTRTKRWTEYYDGSFFVTNMRMVFKCKVDSFDEKLTHIKSVKSYQNGLQVVVGKKVYNVLTTNVDDVLQIIELINKAQET